MRGSELLHFRCHRAHHKCAYVATIPLSNIHRHFSSIHVHSKVIHYCWNTLCSTAWLCSITPTGNILWQCIYAHRMIFCACRSYGSIWVHGIWWGFSTIPLCTYTGPLLPVHLTIIFMPSLAFTKLHIHIGLSAYFKLCMHTCNLPECGEPHIVEMQLIGSSYSMKRHSLVPRLSHPGVCHLLRQMLGLEGLGTTAM